MSALVNDDSLLELVGVVLGRAGFLTVTAETEGLRLLLGEDERNIVAVAALVVPDQLVTAEPLASRFLTERLVASQVTHKRWDAYVVLLCTQPADDEQTETLSELASNLRQVRRLVRVGVEPTRADVARALRPLLPLPIPQQKAQLADPVAAMQVRLLRDGVESSVVDELMEAFRLESRATVSVASLAEIDGTVDVGEELADD